MLDGKHSEVAAIVSKWAVDKGICVLLDGEDECIGLPGFENVVCNSTVIKCSESFPCAFTGQHDLLHAMYNLLHFGQRKQCVITTLGRRGCVLMQHTPLVATGTPSISTWAQLLSQIDEVLHTMVQKQISLSFNMELQGSIMSLFYMSPYPMQSEAIMDTTGMITGNCG